MHTQLYTLPLGTLTHLLCSLDTKGLAVSLAVSLAVTQEDPTGQCLLWPPGGGIFLTHQIPSPLLQLATSCHPREPQSANDSMGYTSPAPLCPS